MTKMNIDVAIESVKLFLKTVCRGERQKKRKNLYIGFYGGEPLLEFPYLKKIIEFTEKYALEQGITKKFNILFRLTTNGSLLNEKITEFLFEHKILVDISLDGPEDEHDKFRVDQAGQKTWRKVVSQIENIKNKFPDYYNEKVKFLATLHPHHDCGKIEEFFLERRDLFTEDQLTFNTVDIDRLPLSTRSTLNLTQSQPGKLYTSKIFKSFEKKFSYKTLRPETPLTGSCFPGGDRIFVNSNGDMSICEKISQKAPKLGDIKNGFDFDSIRSIVRDYNEEIIRNRCWDCDHWFLCNVCLANAFDGKRFRIDCSIVDSIKPILKKYLTEKEEEDETKQTHLRDSIDSDISFFDYM